MHYFKRLSSWVELFSIICNLFIQIQIYSAYVEGNPNDSIPLEVFKVRMTVLRYTFVISILLLLF